MSDLSGPLGDNPATDPATDPAIDPATDSAPDEDTATEPIVAKEREPDTAPVASEVEAGAEANRLPSMGDLDRLSADLDAIDHTLADLDAPSAVGGQR